MFEVITVGMGICGQHRKKWKSQHSTVGFLMKTNKISDCGYKGLDLRRQSIAICDGDGDDT
jgi:hypothetical protein